MDPTNTNPTPTNTEPQGAPVPTPAPTPATPPAAPNAEAIAAALLTALESRTQRAERSVTKSFAEQYGLTEEEMNTILNKAKADKAAQIPAAQQAAINQQLQQINNRLISAEIKSQGIAMGLVDADAALLLIDKTNIKVDDKGDPSGIQEALNALKEAKPYLFGAQPTGQKVTVGGKIVDTPPADNGTARDEMKNALFGGN